MSNQQTPSPQANWPVEQTSSQPGTLDPRDEELLTIRVAEKALEKIRKSVQWPLLLAGAFAAYTGYNVWSDVNKRIETFQTKAEEKLQEIDRRANERLDEELQKVLDAKKDDISELTIQLRKESAGAVVEAERARVSSLESSEKIKKQADVTVAQVNRQATETISALQAKLKEVEERREVVMRAFAVAEQSFSEQNLRIIRSSSGTGESKLIDQPALTLVQIKAALEEIGTAEPIRIAVLATGISKALQDGPLKDRFVGGRSFISGEGVEDANGYGTWIASLVAAMVPSAEVIPVKVLSNRGYGPDQGILAGLDYAATAGAKIVILPLGVDAPRSPVYTQVIESLWKRGTLVFVAAGNSSGPVARPANSPLALAVSATDLEDKLLASSNRGPEIDLAGPGQDILTVGLGGSYKSLAGTGPATAIVGSIAALVLATRPDLHPDDVEAILKQSAKKLDLPADQVGAGRVDALAAVRLAQTYKPGREE